MITHEAQRIWWLQSESESPRSPLIQNRACGFPRTRLLSEAVVDNHTARLALLRGVGHGSGHVTIPGYVWRCSGGCYLCDAPFGRAHVEASILSSATNNPPQNLHLPCCTFSNAVSRSGLVGSFPSRVPQ